MHQTGPGKSRITTSDPARRQAQARKLKIVVDGGNGVGGPVAVPLYEKLSSEVIPYTAKWTGPSPTITPIPRCRRICRPYPVGEKPENADLGLPWTATLTASAPSTMPATSSGATSLDPLLPQHPRGGPGCDGHRRGEVLAHPVPGCSPSRREPGDVEDGALADQGRHEAV